MKTNLVIIPCGKDSTHQKWSMLHNNYNFDLCLINFSNYNYTDSNSLNAKYQLKHEGMKWKLVYDFFVSNPSALHYEYVFIMDDDITTEPDEIHKFFNICKKYNLDLSQPSLDNKSTFTYPSTRKINNSILHTTNMVEIMMPCFSNRLLKETIEDFYYCKNGHGWGLEGVWNVKFHVGNGKSKFGGLIGIVDCVNFGHYRTLGGTESKIYEKYGNPWEAMEIQQTRLNFKWSNMQFVTYEVIK